MTYLRAYIPACEGFGWSGGPEFKTNIVEMANGRERRNADWSQPRHQFTLPFNNISKYDYAGIKQVHLTCRGMLHAFLYRDRLDYQAEQELLSASATAGDDTFQLTKLSIVDGVYYQRNVTAIYSPDPSSPGGFIEPPVTILVDGSPVSASVDRDTGIVTLDSPLSGGETVRWSGEFSIWVRFNQDWIPFSIDNRSGDSYIVNGSIDLIELPPPDQSSSSS